MTLLDLFCHYVHFTLLLVIIDDDDDVTDRVPAATEITSINQSTPSIIYWSLHLLIIVLL